VILSVKFLWSSQAESAERAVASAAEDLAVECDIYSCVGIILGIFFGGRDSPQKNLQSPQTAGEL